MADCMVVMAQLGKLEDHMDNFIDVNANTNTDSSAAFRQELQAMPSDLKEATSLTDKAQVTDKGDELKHELSPTTLASYIAKTVVGALVNPEKTSNLDELHKLSKMLAPVGIEKNGELMDGNADYRDTVRKLLTNVYSSAAGNGPEIGISKYGVITCTTPYASVEVDGKDMFQVRRVVADPQKGTKIRDLGPPWDGQASRTYESSR